MLKKKNTTSGKILTIYTFTPVRGFCAASSKVSKFRSLQFNFIFKSEDDRASLGHIQNSLSAVIESQGMLPSGRKACWKSKTLGNGLSVFSCYQEYDFFSSKISLERQAKWIFYSDRVNALYWRIDIISFQSLLKSKLEETLKTAVDVVLLDCVAGNDQISKLEESFFVVNKKARVETNFFRQLGDMHHRFLIDLGDPSLEPRTRALELKKTLIKDKSAYMNNKSDIAFFDKKFSRQFRDDFVRSYLDVYFTPWKEEYLTWHSRRYFKADREAWEKNK